MQKIEAQLPAYLDSLADFIHEHDLPEEWFAQPDHIAYKCADGAEFDRVMARLHNETQQLSFVRLDGRRLGAAHLNLPIDVGDYGELEWLEIMEPRPEKVGHDIVGLEHIEFYHPDFTEARRVLDDHGVSYEMQENPNHEWINIIINRAGQELKLTNGTLAHVVEDELAEGHATLV